jgi:hypothetical protein
MEVGKGVGESERLGSFSRRNFLGHEQGEEERVLRHDVRPKASIGPRVDRGIAVVGVRDDHRLLEGELQVAVPPAGVRPRCGRYCHGGSSVAPEAAGVRVHRPARTSVGRLREKVDGSA